MSIQFSCSNGHKIRAKDELAGQPAKCPRCQIRVIVPTMAAVRCAMRPKPAPQLTESGVMRVLGDADLLPPPPETAFEPRRYCPRCEKSIGQSVTVCNHCHSFIGSLRSTKHPDAPESFFY